MNRHTNMNQDGRKTEESDEVLALGELSATATKSKLDKLMNDFSSFDDVMRIGTRVRYRCHRHRLMPNLIR